MLDFQEKRKLKVILYSPFTIGILFVLTVMLSISAYERFKAERETSEKRNEQARELESLNQKALLLEAKVERLESDRGFENEVREQFDVLKPGEKAVILVDETKRKETENAILPLEKDTRKGFFGWLKFW